MGFTEKQIGHMSYRKFIGLYEAYKNIFDLELAMKLSGKGYHDLQPKGIDEVIPI